MNAKWLVSGVVGLILGVSAASCGGDKKRETCGNGIDDDNNGLTDCADPDCAGQAQCLSADAAYFGSCAKCSHSCTKQFDCVDQSISRDRPLPECVTGHCQAFNTAIQVSVEYDINSWGGSGRSPQSVLTRFIKKTAVDGTAVDCAMVQAAATGCKAVNALQIENNGHFEIMGWDLIKLQNFASVNLPLVNVGTGSDYLVYTEFWALPPASNSDAPQGNRLGFGCFENAAVLTPITANDACQSATNDAGTCRKFHFVMPGPMPVACP